MGIRQLRGSAITTYTRSHYHGSKSCNNLCPTIKCKRGPLINGRKRCSKCDIYTYCTNRNCPCCGMMFRVSIHNSFVKTRYKLIRRID